MDGQTEKTYAFYGWETALIHARHPEFPGVDTPRDLYDLLLNCWDLDTCAPRLRAKWSKDNPTWGQCSITAFLVQDIYGGRVYGVPLPEGGFHCYNDVAGCVFDLTSEQFGTEKLNYTSNPEQLRTTHFADPNKYARYCLLKERLLSKINAPQDRKE